jgi:hypothetical protein
VLCWENLDVEWSVLPAAAVGYWAILTVVAVIDWATLTIVTVIDWVALPVVMGHIGISSHAALTEIRIENIFH